MSPTIDRELLRRLPKAELHCHLDGSVRPSTLIELGREYHVTMPATDPESLRDFMLVKDARNLEDYLARFQVTLSVMQTPEALERIAYELAEDAAAEGVRYLEVRYAPVLNVHGGMELGETIESALRGLERARADHGIVAKIIVCGLRQLRPDVSLELARLAVAYRRHGVVATFLQQPGAGRTGEVLLNAALAAGPGLLVIGAYGHAHLREQILGGVTATVLKDMWLPVLLAH